MKKVLVVVLALAMIFALAACGDGGGAVNTDPNAGHYDCTQIEMFGLAMAVEDIYENGAYIELNDGGKCVINLDGDSYKADWALDGDAITITIEGVDSVGTLTDGVMVIDLMELGMNCTFVLEGVEIPAGDAAEEVPAE